MRRRIERLPPVMQHEEVYRQEDSWHAFLAWEHEARRVIHGHRDFMLGDDAPDSKDEVF
jgi:aminoglycoside N3'-acetyltransferase